MDELDELKPCPHCGNPVTLDVDGDILCKACDTAVFITQRNWWNTRPIEIELRAEILRLRDALIYIANSDGPRNITTGEGHSDCVWAARRALSCRAENT
jgi:hypothetical protein